MYAHTQFPPTKQSAYTTDNPVNITSLYFRGEYFLIDYMQKIGNFNTSYIDSAFAIEGYSDVYNFNSTELKSQTTVVPRRKLPGKLDSSSGKRIYEFIFIPNDGFLNSNLPLMKNCDLKLSFDRINAEVSMIKTKDATPSTDCVGSPLVIKDCIAITEYITSETIEQYFMKIDYDPIPYYYEECDITLKNLPLEETNIRLDNIRGGNTPTCIFAGIIRTSSLTGDIDKSSTEFLSNNVTEINITLNGNSVNGYPMEMRHGSGVYPFQRFMDVTSRYMNPLCGETLKLAQFDSNWIYAHKFEEPNSQGWLGINIKLDTAFDKPYTLVIWTINDCALTIDKFLQIEKVKL